MRRRFRRNSNFGPSFDRGFSRPAGFVFVGGQSVPIYFGPYGPYVIAIVGRTYYRIPVQLNYQRSGPARSANQNHVSRSPAQKDPYAVLCVSKTATEEEISKAYRSKAKEHHPDKKMHMTLEQQAIAEQKMKEINEAYSFLNKKESGL